MSDRVEQWWPIATKRDDQSKSAGEARLALRGHSAVRAYLESPANKDAAEPFLVLYVGEGLELLASEPVEFNSLPEESAQKLVARGHELEAAALIIVERRGLGEIGVDRGLLQSINGLRSYSAELNMPMLDYLLFDGSQVISVGGLNP